MSNLLEDMENLLSSIESNIYIGSKPDEPDNLICLYHTGGFPPVNMISGGILRQPTFSIIVRDVNYSSAYTRAEAIIGTLNGVVNTNDYISISLYNDIFQLGRDDNNRTELSINFRVVLNN